MLRLRGDRSLLVLAREEIDRREPLLVGEEEVDKRGDVAGV
jgi:hypothetical protein